MTTTCRPTVRATLTEGPPEPDEHGNLWATYTHTGQARATCPCGLDTSTTKKEALDALHTHQEAL